MHLVSLVIVLIAYPTAIILCVPSGSEPTTKQIPILDNVLNGIIYKNVLISSIYSYIGTIECNGVDGTSGLPIASTVLGLSGSGYVDFSGTTLCNLSCSGICVPYPGQSPPVAPASLYPFGCQCPATQCNANGPLPPAAFNIMGTTITCQRNAACTCGNMPTTGSYEGYLCSWWNIASNQQTYLHLNEQYSPIRWCGCCPSTLG